jgi:peptide/nickel transport system substrate-binding protein
MREVMSQSDKRPDLSRRHFLGLAGGVIGAAALAACAPGKAGGQGGGGDTITYLTSSSFIGSWNPYDNLNLAHMRAQRMVYDYLMWIDDNGNFVPGLATSLESISPTVWEAKLRQGVKFHDGQPFTAKDVKASIELASNPKSVTGSLFPGQLQVEVVDDYTARIHTPTPFAPLKGACLAANQSGAIISHKDAEQGVDFLKKKMNGTGPFKMDSYAGEAGGLLLSANTDYWRGTVKVKKVVFKYVSETSTRLAALQSGQADIVEGLGPDEAKLLGSNKNVTVQNTTSTDSLTLFYRTQTAPMNNPKLRQAISYAIDVPTIVKDIYGGYGTVNKAFGQPNTIGYAEDPNFFRYDVAKAKSLLAEAGYPGGNGLPTLEFISVVGNYPKAKEFSEFMVRNLADIGIKVDLKMMDATQWADALFKPIGHMILGGWLVPTPDRSAWYTSLFRTKGLITYASDARVDAAIKAQSEALVPAERAEIVKTQLQPALVDYAPAFPMFTYDVITASSKKVQGLAVPHWYEFDMLPVSKSA